MRRALQALCRFPAGLAQPSELLGPSTCNALRLGDAQGVGRSCPSVLARLLSTSSTPTSSSQDEPSNRSSAGAGGSKRQPGQQQRQRRPRQQRSPLFIPPSWKQAAHGEQQHPLAQQLQALLEAGDARGAHVAFHAALLPLLEATEQGEAPAPGAVPPAYAWKLYFAALSALRANAWAFSSALDLMRSLGVPPQPACYVLALRQLAHQGLGHVAVTKVRQMEDAGLQPTLRCYLSAVEACLRSSPPEHGWARKLLDEVAEKGLAQHASQRADTGKLIMRAARELARGRRFGGALGLLEQLEGLGLRVPALLLAEVTHLASEARAEAELLECVRRLAATTQTFHEAEGAATPVSRPLKVEEGLLLGVLEVAAGRGNVELAEAAWQLLERSLALPNPPSNTAVGGQQQDLAAAAAADDEQLEWQQQPPQQQAGGALESDDSRQQQQHQQQQSIDELEAVDAAEAAQQLGGAPHRAERQPPPSRQAVEAAAAAAEAEPRGMRAPSVVSHLALIHSYATAGRAEPMLAAVARLVEAHPSERATAASYHAGLPMCVDALAASGAEGCDAAFHLLRDWAHEGRPVLAEQLNLVVAACCQTDDLRRAFEAFDSFGVVGVEPNADTYAALMQGCIESGHADTALQVHEQQVAAGVADTAWTHHQLVDARVVSADVPAMLAALDAMQAAGHAPRPALLDRCLSRAERAGDHEVVQRLLELMQSHGQRPASVEAQARRWAPEGGMQVLTGSSHYISRHDVLRQMQGPPRDRRRRRSAHAG